jgi:hypothetical protein
MAGEIKQWECRVQTIGGTFGTKDDLLQSTMDEWGTEGWEAVNVYPLSWSGKVTIVAKRLLTERVRQMRTMPQV